MVTASHRRGLLTQFPTIWVHQGNIFRGNQINLNPIFNALRTGLSMIKMFSIRWGRDSQGSVPSTDSLLPFTPPPPTHKPSPPLPNLSPTVTVSSVAGLSQGLFWHCQQCSKRKGMFLPARGRETLSQGHRTEGRGKVCMLAAPEFVTYCPQT